VNAIIALPAAQELPAFSTVSVTVLLVPPPTSPVPAITSEIPPAPPPPPLAAVVCTEPSGNRNPAVDRMIPVTSSEYAGVVVPMPTLTLAVALFRPLMLPKTRALLSPTTESAPMAVALLNVPVIAWANVPRKVLFELEIGEASTVAPAISPMAVLKLPVVLKSA
jgi:hypothetical protein